MSDAHWTIRCPDPILDGLPDYRAPLVEVDVGGRIIHLGQDSPNSMQHGERSGARIRRFLDVRSVDWSPALVWLDEAAAQSLMHRIDAGIGRSMLWSGDVVIEWTEDAKQAIEALFVGIDSSLV